MISPKPAPRSRLESFLFLALLVALGFTAYASEHPRIVPQVGSTALTVTVFDVGQGDAIFIETPEGKQMLVDGGPNDEVLSKLGSVMPPNDHSIDLVVLTHPHADHVNGLVSVLDRYQVDKVMMSGVEDATAGYKEFRKEIEIRHIASGLITKTERFVFGGVTINVLNPDHSFVGADLKNVHDSMVVLMITDGTKQILLTGDAEVLVEKNIIKNNPDLQIDVLKVGHHGSKTSSSDEFLNVISPTYAVISVGEDNKYGHPNQSILQRLFERGIKLFRTDEIGDITIKTDGQNLTVTSVK